MQMREMGEFNFIKSVADDTICDTSTVICGIGDDCAVYKAKKGYYQLVSTDMMVEGIHFSSKTTAPFDIGYRLGTANISDIAAMGGVPRQVVIAVAAPPNGNPQRLQEMYEGLKAICKMHHVNIIGGDTVRTDGPLTISLTIIGEVPEETALYRSGAQVGDVVGITNTIGDSAVGLESLLDNARGYSHCKEVHRRPEPQVYLGNVLRSLGAHAMNDISDGLGSELNEIAHASGVAIEIDETAMRFHPEVIQWAKKKEISPWSFALYGGEDFQLVFTIPEDIVNEVSALEGIQLIGHVVSGDPKVYLRTAEGEKKIIQAQGYNHFSK